MPKGIQVSGPNSLEIINIDMPVITRGDEVIVEIKAAGVCGSDVHIYEGTHPIGGYPKIIGHELAGVVVETGSEVNSIATGARVVIDPMIPCGTCIACRTGHSNTCSALKVLGVHLDGGYAEYIKVPVKSLHQISDKISWECAALVEPFTVASQVTKQAQLNKDDRLLIIGAGAIGLAILQVAKAVGAEVIVADILDSHLEAAASMGADHVINSSTSDLVESVMKITNDDGVSVVIEAVGVKSLFEAGLKCTSPAARVVALGFDQRNLDISLFDITIKELNIIGSRLNNGRFPEVVDWFEKGWVDPEKLISHRDHFTNTKKALERILERPDEVLKSVITFY